MRKHLIGTSATLVLTLIGVIAACGGSSGTAASTPSSTCVNGSEPHHAYVVVEHLSGTAVQKCVGFSTYAIDGPTLMDKSGIEYQTQAFSFGKAVCQIDSEPAQYSQCFPQGLPTWTLFVETAGAWAVAQTGYTQVIVHDKEALGWRYEQYDPSPALPPLAKES